MSNSCQQCGRDNPVWFAPNEVWNQVMGDHSGFLCPVCFIELAESRGVVPTGWVLMPEALDSGRPCRLSGSSCVTTCQHCERSAP